MLHSWNYNYSFHCVCDLSTNRDNPCQMRILTLWSIDFLFGFWQKEFGKFHINRLQTRSVCITLLPRGPRHTAKPTCNRFLWMRTVYISLLFSSLESQKNCLLTTYWHSYSISSPEKSLMTATLGWKAPPNSSQQKSNKISVDDRVVHACLHAPGWQLNSSSKIGDREILSVTF